MGVSESPEKEECKWQSAVIDIMVFLSKLKAIVHAVTGNNCTRVLRSRWNRIVKKAFVKTAILCTPNQRVKIRVTVHSVTSNKFVPGNSMTSKENSQRMEIKTSGI